MKSYVTQIQGLYAALFSDLAVLFPSIRVELDRDLSRIRSAIEARGLGFVTLDLPEHSKHFDQCLNAQRLSHSPLPYFGSWKKGCTIPKMFRGLYLRVFDIDGKLRIDCDVSAVRALRQIFNCCKKLNLECSDERRFNTVRSFFTIDKGLRLPTLPWSETEFDPRAKGLLHFRDGLAGDHDSLPLFDNSSDCLHDDRESPCSTDIDPGLLDCLQTAADRVAYTLGSFEPREWNAKHGPGAVSDRRGGRLYSKYSFPYWSEKLESVFPASYFAYANEGEWAADSIEGDVCGLINHEPPSSLITVPKEMKGPRLIASEPTSHQWCQQIILDFFYNRVKHSYIGKSISFDSQLRNQQLALSASMHDDFATIDLSEASDRVSCWTIERLFRANPTLLQAIHACRTRWVHNTIDNQSENYYVLRKIACMGSAVTFPAQTILFYVVCRAALLWCARLRTADNGRPGNDEVRVFGDDIVVPTRIVGAVTELLAYLQLKVNHRKTHVSGNFRESCGTDAFKGENVTPVRLRDVPSRSRPESIISCVEVSNNFYMKGYFHTAEWIKSRTEQEVHECIPVLPVDSGSFGWKRNYYKAITPRRKRWNARLHRTEYLTLTPRDMSVRTPDHSPRSLLQYFTEAPSPLNHWTSGIGSRPRSKLTARWVPLLG